MVLIQCPECSGQISKKAVICPHCGFPVRDGSICTSAPGKKTSSQNCMIAAYKKCPSLHEMAMWDIRARTCRIFWIRIS